MGDLVTLTSSRPRLALLTCPVRKKQNEITGTVTFARHNVQLLTLLGTTASPTPPRMPIATRHGGSVPKPTNMTSRQAKIQEDTTFRIMRILQEHPDLSQRDLAEKLGMSLGGLNYCLKALMDKGLVKLENFQSSQHKFKYVYVLTPTGIAQKIAMTGHFLKRKMEEYEALKAEIEALKSEVESLDSEKSKNA